MPAWGIQIYVEEYQAGDHESKHWRTPEYKTEGFVLTLSEQRGKYMSHASSGTVWGDTRSGGTGHRLQKKVWKISE